MKSIILSFLLFCSYAPAQTVHAALEIPVTVFDNSGLPNSSLTLIFGLDPAATDSIDTSLGEFWLYCPWKIAGTDCIPYDHFQAVFDLPVSSGNGFEYGTYKDFRYGTLPYSGVKEHKLLMGGYSAATALYISWDFPEGVSGVLQDVVGGAILNYQMPDSGTFTHSWFMLSYQTKLIITYENAVPVEFTSFTGSFNGSSVALEWSTSSEMNNLGFEVQRKHENNNEWAPIGFVPGSGTITGKQHYYFTDKEVPPGSSALLYRLKQMDLDGTYAYSEIVTIEIMPPAITLHQNYPNPFNPSTIINWSVPQAGSVTLTVYDLLGRETARLVDEEKAAGTYNTEFNAEDLASGIYFYKLQAGEFVQTKKMILLR